MYIVCMQCLSGQEKPDSLGLELQVIVSHYEGSGSQPQVWKKSVLLATQLSSLQPLSYRSDGCAGCSATELLGCRTSVNSKHQEDDFRS